jgi:hypothetical protein
MKQLSFLISFLLLFTNSFGQNSKEFEGKVYYEHTFIINDKSYDSIEVAKSFGASSIYIYSNGNFYWEAKGSDFQYEIYNSKTNLLVDKYSYSDSLKKIDVFEKYDSLISFEIKKNVDKICGYNCNVISVLLQSTKDKSKLKKQLFYSDRLYVNPNNFQNYRSYGNNRIYELIKSQPLRIIMQFEGLPIEIKMNAIRVTEEKVLDGLFLIDKSLIMN